MTDRKVENIRHSGWKKGLTYIPHRSKYVRVECKLIPKEVA